MVDVRSRFGFGGSRSGAEGVVWLLGGTTAVHADSAIVKALDCIFLACDSACMLGSVRCNHCHLVS